MLAAFQSGANAYLSKPYHKEDLLERIQQTQMSRPSTKENE
jgi:CheY-like chemotaxis protein